jgi:hypothetical protein
LFVTALVRGEEIVLDDAPADAALSTVTLCGLHHGAWPDGVECATTRSARAMSRRARGRGAI